MNTALVKPLFSLGLLLIGTASIAMKAEAASTTTTTNSSLSPAVICSYAPSQSSMVSHLAAATGGAAAAAALIAQAAGLTAVAHSSGAFIFTSAGGYVSGTLGAAALPTIVTVGVVVSGSAATLELICVNRNHPELVKKVRAAATEFMNRSRNTAATTSERTAASVGPFIAEFKSVAARARADGFEYANRASVQLGEAFGNKVK